MDEKAAFETKLVNFVKSRTAEVVQLDLSKPSIAVIKQTERGSKCLGTFWMEVLQHPNNYPKERYPYRRIEDKWGYKDLLRVADVTISVYSTGTLTIQGKSLLDWILRKFSRAMDEYDRPPLEPQPISDGLEHEKNLNDLTRKDKEKQGISFLNIMISTIPRNSQKLSGTSKIQIKSSLGVYNK